MSNDIIAAWIFSCIHKHIEEEAKSRHIKQLTINALCSSYHRNLVAYAKQKDKRNVQFILLHILQSECLFFSSQLSQFVCIHQSAIYINLLAEQELL